MGTVPKFLKRALMAFLGLGRPRVLKGRLLPSQLAFVSSIAISQHDRIAVFRCFESPAVFACSDCLGQRGDLSVRGLVFARIPVFPSWRCIVARPIAETFRESVRHVDFFENDLVLTEDVAMPDSEAGLEYSAFVERVEDSLDLAVKDVVSARGQDLDFAYASSHGDDVLSSISRDLVNRFLGDNLRAEGDVGLSDAERSGNGWLRDGLKDGLSEQLFDMIRCSRMGDRDDTNVGWKFVEDVAAGNCVDSGLPGMSAILRNAVPFGRRWVLGSCCRLLRGNWIFLLMTGG